MVKHSLEIRFFFIALFFFPFLLNSQNSPTQLCDAGFYQTITRNGKIVKYSYNGFNLGFTDVGSIGYNVNATGYNPIDDYLYCIGAGTQTLVRFSSDGSFTNFGILPKLTESMIVGAFNTNGDYYVCHSNNRTVYKIDVQNLTVEELRIENSGAFAPKDWAYVEKYDKFYGVEEDELFVFDPNKLIVTIEQLTGLETENRVFGAAFSTINSVLFVSNNNSGNIYYIDIDRNEAIKIINGPDSGINDGASCPDSPPPFPFIYAADDQYCIEEGRNYPITDNDYSSLEPIDYGSFNILVAPTNGTVQYNPGNGSIQYFSDDPNTPDYFEYELCLDFDVRQCDRASVHFYPDYHQTYEEHICEGETVDFYGFDIGVEGNYPISFSSINGCDSTIELNLFVHPEHEIMFEEHLCVGEELIYEGTTYNAPGTYEFNHTSSEGCDSSIFLEIRYNPNYLMDVSASICTNEVYEFEGILYTEAGTHEISYQSEFGCDSIILLDLQVNENREFQLFERICSGEQVEINGTSYTESGDYDQILIADNGCDSLLSISLEVDPIFNIQLIEEICEGEIYIFDNGNEYDVEGDFEINYQTIHGCDSLIDLRILIHPVYEIPIIEEICQGDFFSLDGVQEFREAGNYELNYSTAEGCDSTFLLTLIVNPNFEFNLVEELCDGEVYTLTDGTEFSTTDVYTISYASQNGCDSTLILDLTVHEKIEQNISERLCQGESFLFGNNQYDQSGNYSHIFASNSGCDSTVFLELNVDDVYLLNFEEEICQGETINFGNTNLNESGTYEMDLSTIHGCDSMIVLDLTVLDNAVNNLEVSICDGQTFLVGDNEYSTEGFFESHFTASNGCDSLVTLDLRITSHFTSNSREEICLGESITFHGEVFEESGNYEVYVNGNDGCDSIFYLNLTQHLDASTQQTAEICEGESYSFGNEMYSESGEYVLNLLTQYGCDSTSTLSLTVNPNSSSAQYEEICEGESIDLAGQNFNQGGIYDILVSASNGCDSLINFELVIHETASVQISESICEGEEINFVGAIYNSTGTYSELLQTQFGCDSLVTLELRVNPISQFHFDAEICEGEEYIYEGQFYTTSGFYEFQFPTQHGCDSTITFDFKVNENTMLELDEVICSGGSYQVGTNIYNEEGVFTNLFQAANGCDSTVVLNLSIREIFTSTISENICFDDSYTFYGEEYTTDGIYEVFVPGLNGCDSLLSLDLTLMDKVCTDLEINICQGESYNFGGIEYFENGSHILILPDQNNCDSTVFLELLVDPNVEEYNIAKICAGDSYQVGESSYTTAGDYTDIFEAANSCDSTVFTTLIVNNPSSFTVELYTCEESMVGQEIELLTNINGCDSVVNINTYLLPADDCYLVAAAEGSFLTCDFERGTITLDISIGTPPFNIIWTGPNSGSELVNTLGIHSLNDLLPGNYHIEIVDNNGNNISLSSSIVSAELPEVFTEIALSFSGYEISCFGANDGAALATASGGTPPFSFLWSTGETSQEILGLSEGEYFVTLIDANNCESIALVYMSQPAELILDLDAMDLNCLDSESGSIEVNATGGVLPYSYSLNDSEPQVELTFSNLIGGTYDINVIDANGCSSEKSVFLQTPTPVAVELGEDLYIELGETVSLQAILNIPSSEIGDVIWSDNLETDCGTCLNQIINPLSTSSYNIEVLDANGCLDKDEITIHVDRSQDIYIPNAFSPNGDGINDVFMIYANQNVPPRVSSFHVYDRWGNEMLELLDFDPNNEEYSWDGNYRGEAQNAGVFVWYAVIVFIDGSEVLYKGDVSLLR